MSNSLNMFVALLELPLCNFNESESFIEENDLISMINSFHGSKNDLIGHLISLKKYIDIFVLYCDLTQHFKVDTCVDNAEKFNISTVIYPKWNQGIFIHDPNVTLSDLKDIETNIAFQNLLKLRVVLREDFEWGVLRLKHCGDYKKLSSYEFFSIQAFLDASYPLLMSVYIISIMFYSLTLVLFHVVNKLKKTAIARYWTTYSALSIINYICFVACIMNFKTWFAVVFVVVSFLLEFFVYIWMIFIVMEIFMALR